MPAKTEPLDSSMDFFFSDRQVRNMNADKITIQQLVDDIIRF